MRIQVLSDLHNEFSVMDPVDAGADVVVLAGDIDLGERGFLWARGAYPARPVVYVAGNHEYYRHAMPGLTRRLLAMKYTGSVHFLERRAVSIMGIRFLGCTLWSDFGIVGDTAAAMEHAGTR
ncbi:MAG TPA: metallophosphoesterase, partial [Bacteroidota bacterium]|nr:metallophosphoesterase [Bacteroidota bacterium]